MGRPGTRRRDRAARGARLLGDAVRPAMSAPSGRCRGPATCCGRSPSRASPRPTSCCSRSRSGPGAVSDMDPATRDLFHWISALIVLPAIAYAGPAVLPSPPSPALRSGAHQHGRADLARRPARPARMSLFETLRGGAACLFRRRDHAAVLPADRPLPRPAGPRPAPAGWPRTCWRCAAPRPPWSTTTAASTASPSTRVRAGHDASSSPPGERIAADGDRRERRVRHRCRAWSPAKSLPVAPRPRRAVLRRHAQPDRAAGGAACTAAGEGTLLAEIARLMETASQGRAALRAARRPHGAASMRRWSMSLALATFLGWWWLLGAAVAGGAAHRHRGADHHLPVRARPRRAGGPGGGERAPAARAACSSSRATALERLAGVDTGGVRQDRHPDDRPAKAP